MQNQTESSWYQQIKPSITPPNFVFPIVWTILFILIGISIYLSLTSAKKKAKNKILFWFIVNLILNSVWTLFYFNLHNPLLALVDLILIIVTIVYIIILTHKSNKLSSYLLVPYLLWVSFAGVLNFLSI
jgi:tryptophan-rich sensory protein